VTDAKRRSGASVVIRRRAHWALVGFWEGAPCAIKRGGYVPTWSVWLRVGRAEFRELRADGFYTRRSVRRPTDYVDREYQRTTGESLKWATGESAVSAG
jgi:hypothetical protein